MSDRIPETPEEIRELLEWTREHRPATAKDLEFHTAAGAPDFLILGYLAEECGIKRPLIREQLVAIGWTDALEAFDKSSAGLADR